MGEGDMKRLKFVVMIFSMLFIMMHFSACLFPEPLYIDDLKEKGMLPNSSDFPNTKWICREMDMYFCMLNYNEDTYVGECTISGKTYRVVAGSMDGYDDNMEIHLYSDTTIKESSFSFKEGQEKLVVCVPQLIGVIHSTYYYKDGIIYCDVSLSNIPVEGGVPNRLTFYNSGSINQQPVNQWYAQELDMSLMSFEDTEGYYFEGEIVIDGRTKALYGYEVGNNNYFQFYYLDSKENDTPPRFLVDAYIEFSDDSILMRLGTLRIYPYNHGDWPYQISAITLIKSFPQ